MKKAIITVAIAVGAAVSSFAQGQVAFGAAAGDIWTAAGTKATGIDVAFLVGNVAPAVDTLATSTASNGSTLVSSYASAWSLITGQIGTSFQVISNATGPVEAVATSTALGSAAYNSGNYFNTTVPAGSFTDAYLVSWNTGGGQYTTLAAAAAAGAAVGWSAPFSYTLVTAPTAPATLAASGLAAFGEANVSSTPEPGTIALAGLGISALVALRRRSSK